MTDIVSGALLLVFQYQQVRLKQFFDLNDDDRAAAFQYQQVRLKLLAVLVVFWFGLKFQYQQVRLKPVGGYWWYNRSPKISIPAGPIEALAFIHIAKKWAIFQYQQVRLKLGAVALFAALMAISIPAGPIEAVPDIRGPQGAVYISIPAGPIEAWAGCQQDASQ